MTTATSPAPLHFHVRSGTLRGIGLVIVSLALALGFAAEVARGPAPTSSMDDAAAYAS